MEIRKYADESTTEEYNFLIYCEHCGKFVSEYKSSPESCYKPKLFISASKRRAKELLWLTGHKSALEKAEREALPKLNRCEICGKFICDDCSVINDELGGITCCKKCTNKE